MPLNTNTVAETVQVLDRLSQQVRAEQGKMSNERSSSTEEGQDAPAPDSVEQTMSNVLSYASSMRSQLVALLGELALRDVEQD